MNSPVKTNHKLIISIVKKGVASKVVKASKQAGAEGGTIILGKGTGIHEKSNFFGIPVEPEKEIILTLVASEKLEKILSTIEKAGKLNIPGNGIGFVVDIKRVTGIVHLIKYQNSIEDSGGKNGYSN